MFESGLVCCLFWCCLPALRAASIAAPESDWVGSEVFVLLLPPLSAPSSLDCCCCCCGLGWGVFRWLLNWLYCWLAFELAKAPLGPECWADIITWEVRG